MQARVTAAAPGIAADSTQEGIFEAGGPPLPGADGELALKPRVTSRLG
jgi:hypothetical protein